MGLIGKEMFAVDGCKLPSNTSKEWSGTKEELTKKKEKMEKAIRQIITKHRETDKTEADSAIIDQEAQYAATLREKVKKIKTWLNDNDDKPGKTDKPRKSNVTDNESATMKTSHGVIQGYNGVAMVDSKHQVIAHAAAFGEPQEHGLLEPMVEGTRENFSAIGHDQDVFETTKLTADSGFHPEKNMQMIMEQGIDGYVRFRQRDPRFKEVGRYKERFKKELSKYLGRISIYQPKDFTFSPNKYFCICPAGKRLYRNGGNVLINGKRAVKFRGSNWTG